MRKTFFILIKILYIIIHYKIFLYIHTTLINSYLKYSKYMNIYLAKALKILVVLINKLYTHNLYMYKNINILKIT